MDFDTKKLDGNDECGKLDGTLINVDTSAESLTPNKNIYFVGLILLALGFALIGYGVHRYFNVPKASAIQIHRSTAYTLIGLGCPFIISGLILVFKAAIYLLTLKPFLKKAKYTKCNVLCIVDDQSFYNRSGEYAARISHTLKVEYIDDNGKCYEKIIKGLLAFDLLRKLKACFRLGDNLGYYSFKDYCLAAYNDKGKLILVYKWQELK